MARRTICVGLDPGLYGAPVWGSAPDDNDSTSGLLWDEIRYLCRKAKLPIEDCELITLYFQGWSTRDIATIQKCSHVTIFNKEREILAKFRAIPNVGLITVVVESQGWDGLKYILNGSKTTKNEQI